MKNRRKTWELGKLGLFDEQIEVHVDFESVEIDGVALETHQKSAERSVRRQFAGFGSSFVVFKTVHLSVHHVLVLLDSRVIGLEKFTFREDIAILERFLAWMAFFWGFCQFVPLDRTLLRLEVRPPEESSPAPFEICRSGSTGRFVNWCRWSAPFCKITENL